MWWKYSSSSSSSLLPLSLELSDTKVYEPPIRALLGIAAHFWKVVCPQRRLRRRLLVPNGPRVFRRRLALSEGWGSGDARQKMTTLVRSRQRLRWITGDRYAWSHNNKNGLAWRPVPGDEKNLTPQKFSTPEGWRMSRNQGSSLSLSPAEKSLSKKPKPSSTDPTQTLLHTKCF